MKEFGDFLLNNWYVILLAIVSIILTIINITVKSKNQVDIIGEIKSSLIYWLPHYINLAEVQYLDGSRKLRYVVNAGLDFVKDRLGASLSDEEEDYFRNFITKEVEDILSTPQKKGAK